MKFALQILPLATWVLLIAQCGSVAATTYYVSPVNGDDAASGMAADKGNAGTPWKTLARASRQDFRNGDELLLQCGQTHEGTLDLRVSDGDGQLRIASFGMCAAGDLPRIDGSRPVEVTDRDGRLRADLAFAPGRVLVGGRLLPRSFSLFKVIGGNGTTTSLTLQPSLPKGTDLAQTQVFARTRDWLVEPLRLDGRGGDPANLGNFKTLYPIAAGVALAITGKEGFLRNGDWIYDATRKELVISSPVGPVRASPMLPSIRVRGNGNILVDGLQLVYAGEDAIEIAIKGTAAVRGTVIVSPARRGINLQTAASLYAINNRIVGAGEDAIFIGSSGKATVMRNSIQETATFEPLQPAVGAINVIRAKNAIVAQNTIERSAYVGIRFGEGAEITSNLVVDSCVALSDCAAIYTWQKTAMTNRRQSRVAGNLVVGVYGNDEVKLGFRVWAVGIYLDDLTSAVLVEDNIVFGARQGIYFHNAFLNRAVRNASVGDLEASVSVQLDMNDPFLVARGNLGNDFIGNLLMPSVKAVALSVVRRVRLEPFSQFKALRTANLDSNTAITWMENTGDFDRPTYKPESVSASPVNEIAKGLESKAMAPIPKATDWKVERVGDGFRVSTGVRSFLVAALDQNTAHCKDAGKFNAGALALAPVRVSLFDCN